MSPITTFPDGRLQAMASVTYASDWSIRSGQARIPHLSSVDAVVLGANLGQVFLTLRGLTPDQVRGAWVSHFSVRSGPKPTEDLDNVPVAIQLIEASPVGDAMQTSTLRIRIGSFVGRLSLVHEAPDRPRAFAAGVVESAGLDIYENLYRHTSHHTRDLHLSAAGAELRCVTSLGTVPAAPKGLSGAYWPMPTLIDCLVIGGQMAEVLIYSQGGLDRERSTGMWLRRISMRAPDPRDHGLTTPSVVRIDDIRRYRSADWSISVFNTTCEICSVHVQSSVVDAARISDPRDESSRPGDFLLNSGHD